MGRGTCNIDVGNGFVYAFSATDCEAMDKEKCQKQLGGSCKWDDVAGKCKFDDMNYPDTKKSVEAYEISLLSQSVRIAAAIVWPIIGDLVLVGVAVAIGVFVAKKCRPKRYVVINEMTENIDNPEVNMDSSIPTENN